MMMSSANLMWKAQEVLHRKNSPLVPGALLLIAGFLVVYRHVSHDNDGRDHLKHFLAMIVVQMLPLVALEMKIMSCADPVGLFCRFATPVTMMHALFLLMRVIQYPIYQQGYLAFAILGFAGAVFTISKGFNQRWSCLLQHKSVWGLLLVALVAACCTEYVEAIFHPSLRTRSWGKYTATLFSTTNSYIELMAFVPAVWMVYRENDFQSIDLNSVVTKRTSAAFFLFLVIFYFTEDVWQAYESLTVSNLACIAHLAHFFLLLDFAFYVLAHVYNPEKLMGELRKWLPADLACAV